MPNTFDKAEQIADTVLYEGYMLYPYRASSAKNRQRSTFGTLLPELHPDVLRGTEKCRNQAQCLVHGAPHSTITIRARFLHMCSRVVEARVPGVSAGYQEVDALVVADQVHRTWDEAVECTVDADMQLREILDRPRMIGFEFGPYFETAELRADAGNVAGRVRETQLAISGRIRVSAELAQSTDVYRLTVELLNTTPYLAAGERALDMLSSFASAHTMVAVSEGEFISLLDPPEALRDAAQACKNIGVYPVLAGEPDGRIMLCSPIILYDYPQVAPESAGDFYDGTEMDEMLTLRVMTLTDDEKREMRGSGERLRELLDRTEATARQQLTRTHGAVRSLRPLKDDAA